MIALEQFVGIVSGVDYFTQHGEERVLCNEQLR